MSRIKVIQHEEATGRLKEMVVSYFNFVNRIVLALGPGASEVEMQGYKY
ncbi:MAG: hypothetical protein Q8N05_18655 [Bacteroidota bacterium]|nr:hypothetical protein [Bacteroidota bacterium]